MSGSELNLGADHEQSKRLVSHWHDRWAKTAASYKVLSEEYDALAEKLKDAEKIRSWAKEAFHGLNRAVELLPDHHLFQWEGCRGLLEACPLTEEELWPAKIRDGKPDFTPNDDGTLTCNRTGTYEMSGFVPSKRKPPDALDEIRK